MSVSKSLAGIVASLALLILVCPAVAVDTPKSDAKLATSTPPQVQMALLPQGAVAKIHFYMPQRLELTADKPADLKKAPEMSAPLYGQLKFGGRSYLLAVDEPAGKPAMLYVDRNGNGDFTDDPQPTWTKGTYPGQGGMRFTQYQGTFELPLDGEHAQPVALKAYRFDPRDTQRAALKNTILYYGDYAYDGNVTLDGKSYHAMLMNVAADGDFSGKRIGGRAQNLFLIDINGDGKFDGKRETFDAFAPFNVKGTTWQLADLTPAGSFRIEKSATSVPEIPFPPDLSAGHTTLAFKAQKMDGTEVNFPSDYKGKLVILDFWATWCGPCMMEVPGLVKSYNEFHPQGLEVLGISLDQPNAADKIKSVTAEKGMTWSQVYDGQFWKARIAQLYGIESIPHAFLIDGDTGKILAEGNSLRGEMLANTLRTELAKKAGAAKVQ